MCVTSAISREKRVPNRIMGSFADDLAAMVRTRSVFPCEDNIDIFRVGSGGAGNWSKSESMTLTATNGDNDVPGPGGCFKGALPVYVPAGAPPGTVPSARSTWLRNGEHCI